MPLQCLLDPLASRFRGLAAEQRLEAGGFHLFRGHGGLVGDRRWGEAGGERQASARLFGDAGQALEFLDGGLNTLNFAW